MSDELGHRIKRYERQETERMLLPGLPVIVRVDGRGFSKFTRGMRKPFDPVMADLMDTTAQFLVKKTQAVVAYTQSDEISLILEAPAGDAARWEEMFFGGRLQKLTSVIASLATAAFVARALDAFPEACARELPVFDARVFNVPNRQEAVNTLIWREIDATKNAIGLAAHQFYSTQELNGKNSAERQEMLFQKGINFNDYPVRFKRGVYFKRCEVERILSPDELARIPENRRPDGPVVRTEVLALDLPPLMQVANRLAVVFEGAEPVRHSETATAVVSRSASSRRPR